LAKFPSLRELKLRDNPINNGFSFIPKQKLNLKGRKEKHYEINDIKPDPSNGGLSVNRELLVGRLEKLKMLNLSEITEAERTNSERYFLKWIFTNPKLADYKTSQRVQDLISSFLLSVYSGFED